MTSQDYLQMDYYTRATALANVVGLSGDAELLIEPTIVGPSSHANRNPYQRDDREMQILNAAMSNNGTVPGRSAVGDLLMAGSVASFARTVNPAPAEWLRTALQGTSAPKTGKPRIGLCNFPVVNSTPSQDGVVPMIGDKVDEAGVVNKFGSAMSPYVTPEPLAVYGENSDPRRLDYVEVRVEYQLGEQTGTVSHHFDSRIECVVEAMKYGTGTKIRYTDGQDPEVDTFIRMVLNGVLNAPDFYTTFYHRAVYKRINPNTVYGDSFLGAHWLNTLGCPIPEVLSFSLVTTARGLVKPYAVGRVREKAVIAKYLFQQILLVSSSPSTQRAAGKVQMTASADGKTMIPQLMYMDVGALMYTRPETLPFCFTFDGISGLLVGLNAIYAGFTAQPRTPEEIAEAEAEVLARKKATALKQSLALNPIYMDKATARAITDAEISLQGEVERRKMKTVKVDLIQYGPDHRALVDARGHVDKSPKMIPLMDIAGTFQSNPIIAPYVFGNGPESGNLSGVDVLMPKPVRPIPSEENQGSYDELFASYQRKMNKYNTLVAGMSVDKLNKLADAGEWERLAAIYKRALAAYHVDHMPKESKATASLGTSLGGRKIKQFKSSRNIADIFGSFVDSDEDEALSPRQTRQTKKRPASAPQKGKSSKRK